MKIINYEVESLGKLLFNLPLKGKNSRMRTRLVDILQEHLSRVIGEEKNDLIEQYAERDSGGEIVRDKDGMNKLEESTSKEFWIELNILMNEHLHIDETEANKEMLLSIADIVLEGAFEVSGEVATMYDRWCDHFEETKENYRAKEKGNY